MLSINIVNLKFRMKCLINISKDSNVNGNICDLLGKYFRFLIKYEKQYAKQFDSK